MKYQLPLLQPRSLVSASARATIICFLLAAIAGCRIPNTEFGRLAPPIGVPALYSMTADCGGSVPWPAIDRAHDQYFDSYWKLRAEIAAPMAAACVDAAGRPRLPSIAELEDFPTKQSSMMATLATLDDHLFDAVQAAVPSCQRSVRAASGTRAIARAMAAFGTSGRPTPPDLDTIMNELRLTQAQKDAVSPIMEQYRTRFAAALTVAANAKFDIPRRWLKELEAQGLRPEDLFGPPEAEGVPPKMTREDRRRILEAVRKASEFAVAVELARVEAVNDATIAEISTADPATGELIARSIRSNFIDARRRRMVFVAEAMLEIPAVQSSAMAETFRSYLALEEAEARINELQERARRAAHTDDTHIGPGKKPSKEITDAATRIVEARKQFPELAPTMQLLTTLTAADREALIEKLQQMMPVASAERIAASAPAAVLRADRNEAKSTTNADNGDDEVDPRLDPLLTSGADQFMATGRFTASEQALVPRIWSTPESMRDAVRAALHDAEVVESAVWAERGVPLADAAEKVDDLFLDEQPGVPQAVERYALLARQTLAQLGASDERLAETLSIIHSATADDPRSAATRILLASRRARLDWESAPWDVSALVAPAACPRFDPVTVAMTCSLDAATCRKALALITAHETDWRTAMATASDAAIDTVRTAITQANSTDSDDLSEYLAAKTGASTMARLRDRVQPLHALQARLIEAISAQCGQGAARAAALVAARASVPDYYYLSDPAVAGIDRIATAIDASDPARGPMDAVRGAWIEADGANALKFMELLKSLQPTEIPSASRDIETRLITDARLARLIAERERSAERATRDAWLALPESARAPRGALGGRLRFR